MIYVVIKLMFDVLDLVEDLGPGTVGLAHVVVGVAVGVTDRPVGARAPGLAGRWGTRTLALAGHPRPVHVGVAGVAVGLASPVTHRPVQGAAEHDRDPTLNMDIEGHHCDQALQREQAVPC